ncbi:MAG: nucleotide exchange factor GrpE [Candidatus Binatia bacterium]
MNQKDLQDTRVEEIAPLSPTTEDAAVAAVSTATELEQLRLKLAEKEEEARASQDRFLRERAELENFKKRMQREKSEALRYALEPLIREILPVIDNLERAVQCGEGNGGSVIEGVQMVIKALLEVLERHGVKRVEALGQPFDPTHHQALAQVETAEHEPNRVVEQFHTGYLLHDRLLRPALVTVSARKSTDAVETTAKRD